METIGRRYTVFYCAILLLCFNTNYFAAESGFKEVFNDALYGGLAGGLIGVAILAFTKKPGNHLDYMSYSAAVGVIAGSTYGLVKLSRSLVERENNKVKFAMPTIRPDVLDKNSRGQTPVIIMAELIRGKF